MDGLVSAERLALGTVQWGLPYGIANRTGQPDEAEVARILARARGAGVRVLDTARAYGESEAVIGRLVGADPWWTVVTKLPPLAAQKDDDLVSEASRHLDASHAALRRGRLDVVLLHEASDRHRGHGAPWRELCRRRSAGQIGGLGVSACSAEQALDALDDPEVTSMQVAFNVLDSRLVRRGVFAKAERRGVQLFLRSVYLQGVAHMDRAALPAHLQGLAPTLAAIESWASARRLTRAEAFLLFAREARPDTVVLGCETLAQLEDNLRVWSLPSPPALRDELSALVPELPESLLNPAMWPAA